MCESHNAKPIDAFDLSEANQSYVDLACPDIVVECCRNLDGTAIRSRAYRSSYRVVVLVF